MKIVILIQEFRMNLYDDKIRASRINDKAKNKQSFRSVKSWKIF